MDTLIIRFVRTLLRDFQLPDKRAKTSTRQVVKDALTPQRLSVLSWAFAAVLFGSIGLASLQFGRDSHSDRISVGSGQILPPGGDVTTTASIGNRMDGPRVGLMPTVGGRIATGADEIKDSQIETLQREVVALRRRLNALAEQNVSYSRRIAVLEEQLEQVEESEPAQAGKDKSSQPAPVPGQVKAAPHAPAAATSGVSPATVRRDGQRQHDVSDKAVRKRIESVPAPETMPGNAAEMRRKLQHGSQIALAAERNTVRSDTDLEPVRIAELPKVGPEPVVTGSIGPTDAVEPQDIKPPLITPSKPVGRSSGAGTSLINHSNFGAVVGRYASPGEAAEAWKSFQEQNEERMRDLRPLISMSDMDATYALLVGPFGNAANAAVACLRLLEITGTCHPALYAGAPLPETEVSAND